MSFQLQTLKKRADFLRARNGRYFAANGLVLQSSKVLVTESDLSDTSDIPPRFGFTATKKLGNAVVRNRIKRRLRQAVRLIAPQKARNGYEYVLIGRKSTLKRPFSSLLKDLTIAFGKVHGNSDNNHKGRKPHQAGRPRTDKR